MSTKLVYFLQFMPDTHIYKLKTGQIKLHPEFCFPMSSESALTVKTLSDLKTY